MLPRIGLRLTLLVALLPLALLPWIGLRFVEQMAQLARDERAESLAAAARGVAATLQLHPELFRDVARREPTAPGATPVAPDTFAAPPAHPAAVAEEWLYAVRHELRDARPPLAGAATVTARIALARAQEDPGALYL
ncbi:MAG TPA: hypothetical protein VM491_06485, partial [Burkholderiaceae bacterium]|nr:hypothetical protein [Burkholderiaceae bacterium]